MKSSKTPERRSATFGVQGLGFFSPFLNSIAARFLVVSKEQKQTEDLAEIHHEQQILLPRSLDEYQTKFRDEHNEITKTMICRPYNIRQSWKRKLAMNSSGEESFRW